MKSKIEKLLKDCGNMDMLVELDVFGDSETVTLAKQEFERLKRVIHAAREARNAQNEYYKKGRTQSALKVARQWETELDKALSELWVETSSQERLL